MFHWLMLLSTASADRYSFDESGGKVLFHLVASLHEIDGQAQKFNGWINIGEGSDHTGEVIVQTNQLTTGLGVRDERMYDFVLQTERYPTIQYKIYGIDGDTAGLDSGKGTGKLTLKGALTVATVTKDIAIPAAYKWEDGSLKLIGKSTIQWTDFNLPDPSIKISTLNPPLDIKFSLSAKSAQ
jgi:polyisoprenoid-binding protein YceI